MKHWKDNGVAFSLNDTKWAKRFAWAPDCTYKNGKYYFYYPTDQDYIGVAIGDKPTGFFYDPLGKPLITRQTPGVVANRDLIDPCIFMDDDGTSYLLFGQNSVNIVKSDAAEILNNKRLPCTAQKSLSAFKKCDRLLKNYLVIVLNAV